MFILIFVALISAAIASGLTTLYFSLEMETVARNHKEIVDAAIAVERKSVWADGFTEGKYAGVMLDETDVTTFVREYYLTNNQ